MTQEFQGDLSILAIEDDEADQIFVTQALSGTQLGCELTFAESVAQACELIEERPFDCVLCDWTLPDGSAVEILECAQRARPDLPIVMLSSRDDEDTLERALGLGAQDYLVKGDYRARDLARSIRFAIARKNSAHLFSHITKLDRMRSVGELAAGVAHEVNNPVGWLTANLQWMDETFAEAGEEGMALTRAQIEEMREILEECNDGLARISTIVGALRSYADASSRETERFSLEQVVRQAHTLVHAHVQRAGLFSLEVDGPIPEVEGDPRALTQVFVHALRNSAQAIARSRAGAGTIRVVLSRLGDSIQARVIDDGPGIKPSLRESVFGRSSPEDTRSVSTGVGLIVAREVMESHDGLIRFIEPESGRGAELQIVIPTAARAQWRATTSEPRRPTSQRHDASILKSRLCIIVAVDRSELRRALYDRLGDFHELRFVDSIEDAFHEFEADPKVDAILWGLEDLEREAASIAEELRARESARALPQIAYYSGTMGPPIANLLDEHGGFGLRYPLEASNLAAMLAFIRSPTSTLDALTQTGEFAPDAAP